MGKKKQWVPPPEPEPVKFMDCPDCGAVIYRCDSVWQMATRAVCFDCREEYQSRGLGFHGPAGLEMPGIVLEG